MGFIIFLFVVAIIWGLGYFFCPFLFRSWRVEAKKGGGYGQPSGVAVYIFKRFQNFDHEGIYIGSADPKLDSFEADYKALVKKAEEQLKVIRRPLPKSGPSLPKLPDPMSYFKKKG